MVLLVRLIKVATAAAATGAAAAALAEVALIKSNDKDNSSIAPAAVAAAASCHFHFDARFFSSACLLAACSTAAALASDSLSLPFSLPVRQCLCMQFLHAPTRLTQTAPLRRRLKSAQLALWPVRSSARKLGLFVGASLKTNGELALKTRVFFAQVRCQSLLARTIRGNGTKLLCLQAS